MINRSSYKLMPASLQTHVMVYPNDGIRRTGKARVRVRMPRWEWLKRQEEAK